MKILYISDLFENYIHYQVNNIGESNIEYDIIFLKNLYTVIRDKIYRKKWSTKNIDDPKYRRRIRFIHYFGFPKDIFKQFYWRKIYKSMLTEIFDYDIIHAHGLYPAGFVAYQLSQRFKKPFVVTSHGSDFYCSINKDNSSLRQLIRTVLKKANKVIAVSSKFSEDIKAFEKNTNLIVIENTFNSSVFHKNEIFKKNDESFLILSVGNFITLKNHLELLKIFNECLKLNNNLKLTIIGEGPLEKEYKKFIKNNSLTNNVKIIPYMSQKNLCEYYNLSDLFILPSLSEAFGIVVLEAFACGIPVVSFDTQGPSDIIDNNYNGFLIEKYDFDKMKEKIILLSLDHNLLKEMSNNAIKKSYQYISKIDCIIKLYKDIYNEC